MSLFFNLISFNIHVISDLTHKQIPYPIRGPNIDVDVTILASFSENVQKCVSCVLSWMEISNLINNYF